MSSTTPAGKQLPPDHLDVAASALDHVTSDATHTKSQGLHVPADHEKSHAWFRSVFPYNSLGDLETSFHLGNYVRYITTNKPDGHRSATDYKSM